ncbi:MAG TPA: hypothetical protein VGJ61_05085, partial [Solirubrobacterales bacterium]
NAVFGGLRIGDDDRHMSARDRRAAREGEAHAATRNSNTRESFIVGVGAPGALLAGAAIVFVTLVGLVSFNVWPSHTGGTADGNLELSAARATGSSGSDSPVSAATALPASATPVTGSSGGGGKGGGHHDGGSHARHPAASASGPTPSTPPSSRGGPDDTGGSGNAQGGAPNRDTGRQTSRGSDGGHGQGQGQGPDPSATHGPSQPHGKANGQKQTKN